MQAKAEWEHQERRDDLLVPAGFQLERARTLLVDPGDLAVADIQEYIALSSAREESQRKERDEALATAVAKARTARLQQITRWAFAAVGAVTVIAAAIVGYSQWDKARQLAALADSLIYAQSNVFAALSSTKLLGGEIDSALRLASRGASIGLASPSDAVKASPSGAALAAAVRQAKWRFALGHDDIVYSAAFSPDGSRIVTASRDKAARIWDAATAEEIAVLRGHDGAVNSATFSPDGSRIVTASRDKTARIWDAATAKEIAVLRGHDSAVISAAFSPDGSRIVTASDDKTARIWNAATAKEIAVLRGHDGALNSAAFSRDGSRIVTASWDATARIWNAATAKEIAVLRGHDGGRVFGRLQPRRVAHRHGVRRQDRPHLGRRHRQGGRGPARP